MFDHGRFMEFAVCPHCQTSEHLRHWRTNPCLEPDPRKRWHGFRCGLCGYEYTEDPAGEIYEEHPGEDNDAG